VATEVLEAPTLARASREPPSAILTTAGVARDRGRRGRGGPAPRAAEAARRVPALPEPTARAPRPRTPAARGRSREAAAAGAARHALRRRSRWLPRPRPAADCRSRARRRRAITAAHRPAAAPAQRGHRAIAGGGPPVGQRARRRGGHGHDPARHHLPASGRALRGRPASLLRARRAKVTIRAGQTERIVVDFPAQGTRKRP
jgi:hypothetical protein